MDSFTFESMVQVRLGLGCADSFVLGWPLILRWLREELDRGNRLWGEFNEIEVFEPEL
jgi:hypothetical protein